MKRPNAFIRLLREPFLQFLFLGALIFAGSQLVQSFQDRSRHTIVVDDTLQRRIVDLYLTQTGATPSPAQVAALTENYIQSEILYREALKLGLDRNDEIVKRRLVQKMSFLTADRATVPPPTDADVAAYYDAHKADFATAPQVTFHHVFFRADAPGARQKAEAALTLLRDDPSGAHTVGDPFPLEDAYSQLSKKSAMQIFGDTPLASALYTAPVGQWMGPYQSGYGWHLVFVSGRTESAVPALADIRDEVAKLAQAAAQTAADEKAYAVLKTRYTIVRTARPYEPENGRALASAETKDGRR